MICCQTSLSPGNSLLVKSEFVEIVQFKLEELEKVWKDLNKDWNDTAEELDISIKTLSICVSLCVCVSLSLSLSLSVSLSLSISLSLAHTHTHIHTHSLSINLSCRSFTSLPFCLFIHDFLIFIFQSFSNLRLHPETRIP